MANETKNPTKATTLMNQNTSVRITERIVEYRTPVATGTAVVRVILNLPTPRIMAWAESSSGPELEPMSLFLDEILAYVTDAKQQLASM